MKVIIYYLLLLVLLALTAGYALSGQAGAMSMQQIYSICGLLAVYTVGMSLVGEVKNTDERDMWHRNFANRVALIAGTAFISIAIFFQLFRNHSVDLWLLAALVVVNLTKIITLIYANYRR